VSPLGYVWHSGSSVEGTAVDEEQELLARPVPWITEQVSSTCSSTLTSIPGRGSSLKRLSGKSGDNCRAAQQNLVFATACWRRQWRFAVNRDRLGDQTRYLAGVLSTMTLRRSDLIALPTSDLRAFKTRSPIHKPRRRRFKRVITRESLRDWRSFLPPLDEQREDRRDPWMRSARVGANRKGCSKITLELKRSLLHQLFTQGLAGTSPRKVHRDWDRSPGAGRNGPLEETGASSTASGCRLRKPTLDPLATPILTNQEHHDLDGEDLRVNSSS